MNPLTGVLILNKTLVQDECSDYVYFIKATDLFQERLSSMLSFKIHVVSSQARFKHRHYTINITENTEDSINLTDFIKIYNFKSDTQLRLDEASRTANRDFFTIDSRNSLIFKRRPDFEGKNYFRFELVLTQLGKDIDTAQVEINVIDQNEYSPVVEDVLVGSGVEYLKSLSIHKISDDYTYLITANLTKLLTLDHSSYFVLFQVRASDQDNGRDVPVGYSLEQTMYYELVQEEINMERFNKLKEVNASQFGQLFLVDKENGGVRMNLKYLNQQVHPTAVFFKIKVRMLFL